MAEKYKKLPKMKSPKGVFKFPALVSPDYGNQEYPKPDGVYKVALVLTLSDPATTAFIAALQPHYDEAVKEANEEYAALKVETRKGNEKKGITGPVFNPLYTELYDKETEEATGEIEFRFSMKASGKRKKDDKPWSRSPDLFDAKGKPFPRKAGSEIWGGTVGKIAFEIGSYFIPGTCAAGVSLKLQAAQIIDLVAGGGRDAGSYGFGEEDGYEADQSAFGDETTADAVDDDGGNF